MKRADFIRYWRRSGLENPDKRKICIKKNVRKHFYHQFYPVLAKIRINQNSVTESGFIEVYWTSITAVASFRTARYRFSQWLRVPDMNATGRPPRDRTAAKALSKLSVPISWWTPSWIAPKLVLPKSFLTLWKHAQLRDQWGNLPFAEKD